MMLRLHAAGHGVVVGDHVDVLESLETNRDRRVLVERLREEHEGQLALVFVARGLTGG
jgi:hypothetical protein